MVEGVAIEVKGEDEGVESTRLGRDDHPPSITDEMLSVVQHVPQLMRFVAMKSALLRAGITP